MRIRTPRASAAALLLLLAGCGGGDASPPVSTAEQQPTLAAPAAERLVVHSDAVALKLAAGDVCGAAEEADKLQGEFVALVNEGQVPAAFQEELGARVSELVNGVNCPPPPPAATEAAQPAPTADPGKGKTKGHDKQKKHGRRKGDG